jgi:peroxiredoxin
MTQLRQALYILILVAVVLVPAAAAPAQSQASAQPPAFRPVILLQPMPDFTLPALQGGEVTLSKLRGKNVLLIFPRGLVGDNSWCHIDNYQYSDPAETEKLRAFRKSLNLEVLFVMPYERALVQQWADKFVDQFKDIEAYRNPPDPAKLDAAGKSRMDTYTRAFPKKFAFEGGKVPFPFPVLVDADRMLSKSLGLFTLEWGGRMAAQNIPTVFIIDAQGVVRFKYVSQSTADRPSTEYLLSFIEKMLR